MHAYPWTNEEIELLKEQYLISGTHIEGLNRTAGAIYKKANELGLRSLYCTKSHIGKRRKMNNGMMATLIAYRTTHDIDVQFDDGYISFNKEHASFLKGQIGHPSTARSGPVKYKKQKQRQRLGQKKEQRWGLVAEIIEYTDTNHIKVRFSDGAVVKTSYFTFSKGTVSHPNHFIGQSKRMRCGLIGTVTEYDSKDDIVKVLFEDGEIVTTNRGSLHANCVRHPFINPRGGSIYKGFKLKRGIRINDEVYYPCTCQSCGKKDILTPQEMMKGCTCNE